jgi:HSP20 family protein
MNLIPRNQIFDFDSLFNDFFPGFGRSRLSASNGGSMAGMRVDVHENDKEFEIHADLPGVKKSDIEVTLENDILTVSASKNTESEKKDKGKVVWRERSSGSISRSFSVSPGTSEKDVKANFEDGVLTLTVPKKQQDKAGKARRISIK